MQLVNESLLVFVRCWKGDCNRLLYVFPLSTSFEKQNTFKQKVLSRLLLSFGVWPNKVHYRAIRIRRKKILAAQTRLITHKLLLHVMTCFIRSGDGSSSNTDLLVCSLKQWNIVLSSKQTLFCYFISINRVYNS